MLTETCHHTSMCLIGPMHLSAGGLCQPRPQPSVTLKILTQIMLHVLVLQADHTWKHSLVCICGTWALACYFMHVQLEHARAWRSHFMNRHSDLESCVTLPLIKSREHGVQIMCKGEIWPDLMRSEAQLRLSCACLLRWWLSHSE